ncbi:MAG TPA: methyltransferase domain-containing protein [Bryobacteraceae bacterium]|nr:methyltransferase domain-containing protein [Bryobacteraceae bacterium]
MPWQSHFFRGVALDFWRLAMTPEITASEVQFLERALAIEPGARLLDVPCGNGRHAIELARRGCRVTGIDLAAEYIEEARRSPVDAEWIAGDMSDLPWSDTFDGAYCMGNSFGYLDRAAAPEFLGAIARCLKSGGRFAMATGMAAESILPSLQPRRWHRTGDILTLSEARYEIAEGRLDIDYTFIRGGEIETRPSSSYVFTVAELRQMHSSAGLEPVELSAWGADGPYRVGSPGLLMVSRKLHSA